MSDFNKAALASDFGHRFVLNFLHCWKDGVFNDEKAVRAFLKAWWKRCVELGHDKDPDRALGLLASLVNGNWGKTAGVKGHELARVVSFTTFYSPPTSARPQDYSLLNTKYAADTYGIGFKALQNGDIFRKLERINGDAEAPRPGAQV